MAIGAWPAKGGVYMRATETPPDEATALSTVPQFLPAVRPLVSYPISTNRQSYPLIVTVIDRVPDSVRTGSVPLTGS